MTRYIRQLTEEGLIKLGTIMNTLNHLSENPYSEEHQQHSIAKCALEIEDILKNHIMSLDYEVNLDNK